MFCINCGKEVPDVSMFCPFCGQSLKVTEMTEEVAEKEEESTLSEYAARKEKIDKAFQMYLTDEEINGKNVQLVSNLDLSDEDIRDYFDREFDISNFEYDEKLLLSYSQNMMKHTGFWLTNYKIFWKYDNSFHSHGCWNLEDIDSVSLSKELGDNWIRLLTRDKKCSDFILTNHIADVEQFKCRLEMFFYDINRKNVNIKRDFEKYLEIACNSVGGNPPNLYRSRFYDDRAVKYIKEVRDCLLIPEDEKIYLALNIGIDKGTSLAVTESGVYYVQFSDNKKAMDQITWEELKTATIEVPKYYSDMVYINKHSIRTYLCKGKVLVKILSQIQDMLRLKWEEVVSPYIGDDERQKAWLNQRVDLWEKYDQGVEQQKNEELIKKNEEALQAKAEAERELQEIREREERRVQREKEREERRKQKAEAKKATLQKAEEEKLRKEEEKRIIAEIGEEAYKKQQEELKKQKAKEELLEKAQKRLEKIEEEERQYAKERAERFKRGEMGEPLLPTKKVEQEESLDLAMAAYKLKEKVVGKERLEEEWKRKKEKEEKKAQQEKERRIEQEKLKQKNAGKEKEELRKKAQERLEKIEAEEREYERQQAENLRRRKEGLPEINYEQQREQETQNAKKGKYSFTFGILSVIACFIMPIIADILAVLGIIFGVKGIKTSNKRKAQIGIVLCVLVLIWNVINVALG